MSRRFRTQLLIFVLVCANLEVLARILLIQQGYETLEPTAKRDAVRGWRLRSAPDLNSDGLRGPELPSGPDAAETRILALGGSVTYGWSCPAEQAYPRVLEDELRRAGGAVRVVNGGTPGFSSSEMMGLLRDIGPRCRPRLVTVMCGFNDLHGRTFRAQAPGAVLEQASARDGLRGIFYHSGIYRWLLHTLRPAVTVESFAAPDVKGKLIAASLDNLNIIYEYCKIQDARMVLIEEAHRRKTLHEWVSGAGTARGGTPTHSRENYLAMVDALRDAHREWARGRSVPFVDMDEVLQKSGYGEDELFVAKDTLHLTPLGNRLAAGVLAPIVRSLLPSQ